MLDTISDTFSLIVATGVTAASARFYGATALRNKIYFTPYGEAKVGVLGTVRHTEHTNTHKHTQTHTHTHTHTHIHTHAHTQ